MSRAMVSTRSMTARTKVRRSVIAVALPHDVIVNIVSLMAAISPQPIADLYSLRATYKTMYKASKERAMGRRVALEQEEMMKWLDSDRYLAIVNHLVDAGNPEACFIIGLTLIFTHHDMQHGLVFLERGVIAGHKAAAYVLELLLYKAGEVRDVWKQYISQVEGEPTDGCETAKRTNRECSQCRRLAADVVQAVMWKMDEPPGWVWALSEDGHRCTRTGCGVTEGWDDYVVFCSDDCRIRHGYTKFFAQVLNYL